MLVEPPDARLPKRQKDLRFRPRLEPVVSGRMGDELGLIQGLPLAARAQHVEDRVRAGPVRPAGATAAKTVRVRMRRQQGFQHRPESIQDPKPRGWPVVRRARAFAWLSVLRSSAHYYPYSDRLLA